MIEINTISDRTNIQESNVIDGIASSHDIPKARVILIGDSGTGKTSLVKQLATGVFEPMCSPTIGIDYHLHIFTQNELEGLKPTDSRLAVDIWDSAGQERFRSLSSSYFRNISGVLLVFDLNNPKTFWKLEEWINYVYENTSEDTFVMLLVGNKCDLDRKVPRDEIDKFSTNKNIPYIETSSTDTIKTQMMFQQLGDAIIKKGHFRGVEGGLMPAEDIKVNLPDKAIIQARSNSKCCFTNRRNMT
ncbi:Ras-related protein Rab-39B [Oopsacas minuta]|uniref:Ras-related protein Rab-39B n=1 Tax=Oopsacas minuta TaxID=111878 RepID=A0AAV7KJ02_9METZ|nr:Ras-related protein Rab-39B [Oopsacas minuta]